MVTWSWRVGNLDTGTPDHAEWGRENDWFSRGLGKRSPQEWLTNHSSCRPWSSDLTEGAGLSGERAKNGQRETSRSHRHWLLGIKIILLLPVSKVKSF